MTYLTENFVKSCFCNTINKIKQKMKEYKPARPSKEITDKKQNAKLILLPYTNKEIYV